MGFKKTLPETAGFFRVLSEKCDALFGLKSALKQKIRALFRSF